MWRFGTGLHRRRRVAGHAVVPDDGHVAERPRRHHAEGLPQRRAHAGRSWLRRSPAAAFDFCYLTDRHRLHDAGDRPGDLRRRPEADAAQVAAPGGRRRACREHPEVPAEAAQLQRLQRRRLHAGQGSRRACRPSSRAASATGRKPGVGQQAPISPQTYAAGPGGVPLPAAPVSTPI